MALRSPPGLSKRRTGQPISLNPAANRPESDQAIAGALTEINRQVFKLLPRGLRLETGLLQLASMYTHAAPSLRGESTSSRR